MTAATLIAQTVTSKRARRKDIPVDSIESGKSEEGCGGAKRSGDPGGRIEPHDHDAGHAEEDRDEQHAGNRYRCLLRRRIDVHPVSYTHLRAHETPEHL